MNNYFLANVSNRKKGKLTAAAIPYVNMEIDGVDGIVIEEANIVACLGILGVDLTAQYETSLPGIVKVETVASATVTFNPIATATDPIATAADPIATAPAEAPAAAEPKIFEVVLSAPRGYRCGHWESLFKDLKSWANDNLRALNKKVFFHYAYDSRPDITADTAKDNELHIVLSQSIEDAGEGAKTTLDNNTKYYPTKHLIHIKNLPDCPDGRSFEKIIGIIRIYAPVVLAATLEEAEKLIPYEIHFASWEGDMKKSRMEAIIRSALPQPLFDGVIIKVPHNNTASPAAPDNFLHIFIWSAPYGDRNVRAPEYMWGHAVGIRDAVYSPTETGITIYEERGYPVAEIIDNNLYIFHDACHYDYSDDYRIFEKIIQEAAKQFKLTREERAALANTPRVVMANQGGETRRADKIKELTETMLLPVLGKKIVIHNTNGKVNQPQSNGLFHIWLFSSAGGEVNKTLPATIFGLKVSGGWNCFIPSETGIEIIDEETLYSPAELLENNLYIHIPLAYLRDGEGLNIYQRLLELTIAELNKSPEEKAERDRAIKEIRRQKTIKNYVKLCQKRQEVARTQVKQELATASSNIVSLQKRLIETIRQEGDLRHRLNGLETQQSATTGEFETEYNRLFNLEGVEGVTAQEDKLIINTYPIFITTQNESGQPVTFDIGKFRIEVYYGGEYGGIRFFNVTRKGKGGYNSYNIQHPHVNVEGIPCLGNIKQMIAQLIAEYKFAAIAALAIQYLESVNLDDQAGAEIFKCWPMVAQPEGGNK